MVLKLYKLMLMARAIARQKLSGNQNLQRRVRSRERASCRISPAADHYARDIWRSVIVLKCRQGPRRALRGSCNHLDKQALALAAEHSSNYHTICILLCLCTKLLGSIIIFRCLSWITTTLPSALYLRSFRLSQLWPSKALFRKCFEPSPSYLQLSRFQTRPHPHQPLSLQRL